MIVSVQSTLYTTSCTGYVLLFILIALPWDTGQPLRTAWTCTFSNNEKQVVLVMFFCLSSLLCRGIPVNHYAQHGLVLLVIMKEVIRLKKKKSLRLIS